MNIVIEILIFAAIGTGVGYMERDFRDKVKKLEKKLDEPKEEVGTVGGEYGKVNQFSTNNSPVGLVEPKTPEQLEWEEQERLRQANLEVKVK